VGVFGAPKAQEDHAVLACKAALAIHESFRIDGGVLSVRTGLHSGQIVFSTALTGPANVLGTYGITLHLGSRLPPLVNPGEICISRACYDLVRPFCEVKTIGRRVLRGVPQPVELYLLNGMKPAIASQQFRQGALTPFVGRNMEMAQLKDALRPIDGPKRSIIGIVGPAGAGKSRLCFEFAEYCRGRLIPVFEARVQPYGAATPLHTVLEFLRSPFFCVPQQDATASVTAVGERLAEIGATEDGDLALVCDFLGIPFQKRVPSSLGPRARTSRLLEIVRCLVRHRGAAQSVIIIEDLHWLDESSEAFVATVADAVVGTETILIVNCRPSYSNPWMRAPNYQQIDLRELDLAATASLVEQLIGNLPRLAEVRRCIAERSGGNPFFIEELVRSTVDQAVVAGQPGGYSAGPNVNAQLLPATVQAVIGARIDRLRPMERDLLHTSAIIGKKFPLAVLQAVAGYEPEILNRALDDLCEAGLLHLYLRIPSSSHSRSRVHDATQKPAGLASCGGGSGDGAVQPRPARGVRRAHGIPSGGSRRAQPGRDICRACGTVAWSDELSPGDEVLAQSSKPDCGPAPVASHRHAADQCQRPDRLAWVA
jgi:adenylate cyclase